MEPTEKPTESSRPGARHRWFPVVVIAAAVAWWAWRYSYAQYHTLVHVLVVLSTTGFIASWYLLFGGATKPTRRWIVGGLGLVMFGFLAVFRPVYNGDMGIIGWKPRFARDADERLGQIDATGQADDWQSTPTDYPRFLGNGYWAEVSGVELETDWQIHPPKEMWRREIGGGWSAFAVVGNYAVTQEQRGENELVTCYRVDTGEPVWTHADRARFDPVTFQGGLGDIGPRATPTVHGERIFTQGGTGIVNCIDARTGKVLWSHDTAEEFETPVAVWGKSGSPLIVDDMVVISVGYLDGEAASAAGLPASPRPCSLVAFDIATGDVRWAAGAHKASYSTPVLATLAGERQIIVVNECWVTSHRASDGEILWEHPWRDELDHAASVAQPVPLEGDRLLLTKGYGIGASLLSIRPGANGKLSAEPLWNPPIKPVMKTKFTNIVIRDGFVYGLDDVLLECIELETGKVRWKKRRTPEFGHGQVMLIGDVLLVQSEHGELALVEASPEEYRELATLQALDEANVSWNTPAFAPPYLLIRNNREAACYRLPTKQQ